MNFLRVGKTCYQANKIVYIQFRNNDVQLMYKERDNSVEYAFYKNNSNEYQQVKKYNLTKMEYVLAGDTVYNIKYISRISIDDKWGTIHYEDNMTSSTNFKVGSEGYKQINEYLASNSTS